MKTSVKWIPLYQATIYDHLRHKIVYCSKFHWNKSELLDRAERWIQREYLVISKGQHTVKIRKVGETNEVT